MITNGNTQIAAVYLGDTSIKEIYKGNDVIYSSVVRYSVATDLNNITSDAPSSVVENAPLTVTLTPNIGLTIDVNSVVVLMGCVDITATAYSAGIITIAEVTGNVSITADTIYDAEVEWLQSDGTAYIDTDIILTSSHIVDIDFTYQQGQRLIGARKDNTSYASYGVYSANIDCYATGGTISNARLTMTVTEGNRYRAYVQNGKRQYFNAAGTMLGQNTYSAASFSTERKTPIFGLRWGVDNVTPAVGTIHSLSITYSGSKVLDFIPVRKHGVGYLYDKVSKTLYGNANSSGAFTYGDDKNS